MPSVRNKPLKLSVLRQNSPHKSLIIVCRFEIGKDFIEIAHELRRQAPDVFVAVCTPSDTADIIPPAIWRHPCLTIGVGSTLGRFVPRRGPWLENTSIKKLGQYTRMTEAGVNTPLTERFEFGCRYDPEIWGEIVIVKPLSLELTSQGGSVRLFRAKTLSSLSPEDLPTDHLLRQAPAIVQQFVDTGSYPSKWRVLSLLGEPLYSSFSVSLLPRADLSAEDDVIMNSIAEPRTPANKIADVSGERDRLLVHEEVLAFAKRVHAAFPKVPLLGMDILRRDSDKSLFALEVNAGGNVWHFTSYAKQHRERLGGKRRMIDQLGAWSVAAGALIKATREMAS
jgi:hypothetical protein